MGDTDTAANLSAPATATTIDGTDSGSIAFLGPEGSFSHFVARLRHPDAEGTDRLIPCKDIPTVFQRLREIPATIAIVPIENSSGGIITPTVDCILEDSKAYQIIEEMTLNVRLALLGRSGTEVTRIYSHFAPFHHCGEWLHAHYPDAEQIVAPSTSSSIETAAARDDSAAIGPRDSAARHGLEVLHFPIEAEVPNVTQFFAIAPAGSIDIPPSDDSKTSLVVMLPDSSGSLCDFLTPFARAGVNLKRIESRPIRGRPNTYRFFVEVDGHSSADKVAQALADADAVSVSIHNMGSYPAGTRYES
jgi:chorismate mutase/prephenate dehydratase